MTAEGRPESFSGVCYSATAVVLLLPRFCCRGAAAAVLMPRCADAALCCCRCADAARVLLRCCCARRCLENSGEQ
eukprot:CAMPEP_0171726194 /NCGR_PEP_ID=MMETSP0991-20121206/25481_1 /TAXON_ID=483369 /ORGANISM="non described non described, Strain CCMP2098" /LENGTH=74 /DNA_ID=CAMNT_0012319551 /DNA_START=84 /DNA_END=308 /DNA_ORIENTATION=+